MPFMLPNQQHESNKGRTHYVAIIMACASYGWHK